METAHRDGFAAGVAAVIAALREPREALLDAMWRAYDSADGESMLSIARSIADELEKRG